MRYQNPRSRQAVQTINVVCCLLFVSFCFCYLYFFQADVLSMAQHVLSHGRTHFQLGLYTSLLTILLTSLGLGITYYVHLPIRYRAILWLPSYGFLGYLTDIHLDEASHSSSLPDILSFAFYVLAFFVLLFLAKQVREQRGDTSPVIAFVWPNLLLVSAGMIFALLMGNTNKTLHYELRMERLVSQGNYDRLLSVCADDQHPSRCVISTRAYALSQQGALGERLFTYNNSLGSDALLPSPTDSIRPANLPARLRAYLGGFPIHDMPATHFLEYLAADTAVAQPPVRDYLLCALLLDRNLPAFTHHLVQYYAPQDTTSIDDDEALRHSKKKSKKQKEFTPVSLSNLPRHYAEALLLYSRSTTRPEAVLDDAEVLQNYLDFTNQLKTAHNRKERASICRDYYGNTYWCYYYYGKD